MATFMVQITKEFTEDDLENIMITALEGGIGYWACLDNSDWNQQPADMPTSEYAWKILRDGGTLHFLDEEDDGAEYFLDLSSLLDGIGKCIVNKDWDGDMDNIDAIVADMIIQYAIFGSVIYG